MIRIISPVLQLQIPVLSVKLSEEILICGIKSRSECQFRQLHKMYAPALLGIISRIIRSEVIAQDVLQESFIKIWHGIDSYDASRGRLFTWMAATARHTAIDQLRSRAGANMNKTVPIDEFTLELEARYHTEMNSDAIGLKQLTHHLKEAEKKILELIYFQGYSHSEVAKELNMPLGTVKTKVRRAIGALRAYFA